jgi:hypothetical protein
MIVYERPRHYLIIHLFFGFISVFYPIIGILALVYQFGQLYYNVRVFPVEGKILPGNSIQHTGLKLFEMAIGYLFGILILYFKK